MPDKTTPHTQEGARALYENLDESDHADWDDLGESAKEPWLRAWRAALSTTLEPSEVEIEAATRGACFYSADRCGCGDPSQCWNVDDFARAEHRAGLIAAARVRVGE